ncbi:MAG: hypothetical protein U1E76_21990 [Planctomycetota bacterium]
MIRAPARSFLPFGPRGVGKSTWAAAAITGAHRIDLLDEAAPPELPHQSCALRRVDTLMVRVKGASHDIGARPSQLITKTLNVLAWLGRHQQQSRQPERGITCWQQL